MVQYVILHNILVLIDIIIKNNDSCVLDIMYQGLAFHKVQ